MDTRKYLKFMKIPTVLTILLLTTLTGVAFADTQQFNFTYSDSLYRLQGVLDATQVTGGYLATGVTGTLRYENQTYALTLIPVGTTARSKPGGDDLFTQDNLLFPNIPDQLLTTNFILFTVPVPPPNGITDVALWANGASDYGSETFRSMGGYGAGSYTGGTFTLSAVPEPGSILLLGTLLLGVAGVLKRKVA